MILFLNRDCMTRLAGSTDLSKVNDDIDEQPLTLNNDSENLFFLSRKMSKIYFLSYFCSNCFNNIGFPGFLFSNEIWLLPQTPSSWEFHKRWLPGKLVSSLWPQTVAVLIKQELLFSLAELVKHYQTWCVVPDFVFRKKMQHILAQQVSYPQLTTACTQAIAPKTLNCF